MNHTNAELLVEFVEGWRAGRSDEWMRRRIGELLQEGVPSERIIGAVEFGVGTDAAGQAEELLRDQRAAWGAEVDAGSGITDATNAHTSVDDTDDGGAGDGGLFDFLRNDFWEPSSIPLVLVGFFALWWLIGVVPGTWSSPWPFWAPVIVLLAVWVPWALVALALKRHGKAPGEWSVLIPIGMSVVGIAVLRFPNTFISHGAHPVVMGSEAFGAVLGLFGMASAIVALPVWGAVKAFRLNRSGLIFAWSSIVLALVLTYLALNAP